MAQQHFSWVVRPVLLLLWVRHFDEQQ